PDGKRLDDDVVGVERSPQLERALRPDRGLLRPLRIQVKAGEVGVGEPELATRRKRFQRRDGLLRGATRLGDSSGTPEDLGRQAERFTLPQRIAETSVLLERSRRC